MHTAVAAVSACSFAADSFAVALVDLVAVLVVLEHFHLTGSRRSVVLERSDTAGIGDSSLAVESFVVGSVQLECSESGSAGSEALPAAESASL